MNFCFLKFFFGEIMNLCLTGLINVMKFNGLKFKFIPNKDGDPKVQWNWGESTVSHHSQH